MNSEIPLLDILLRPKLGTVLKLVIFTLIGSVLLATSSINAQSPRKYPASWFAAINDPNKVDWEILPQEAKAGEVILSKRNELGILSNFAATPFELYGERYASVEGFWQMMLYPEGPDDERAKDKRVTWKYTREQVAQMTAVAEARTGRFTQASGQVHTRRTSSNQVGCYALANVRASAFAPQLPASITNSSSPPCVPKPTKTPK